jgi:hypothetical protein
MNLYSLISNYETSNKYTKHMNTCAHIFNVVATIIQVKRLFILCVKHYKVNRGLIILFFVIERSPWLTINTLVISILTYAIIWS